MSFFNPEIPIKQKVVSHHPWEKYIKDAYRSTYKYGHNSAKNTIYPPQKVKVPSVNREKFTVIGNRVTKEFIYSTNLVKGLHKYRWRYFDAPVIRGVTGVEWPKVWNDLKIQYGGSAYCLESQVAILINDKFLGGDKELKELIESKYVYHIRPDYYTEAVKQLSSFIKSSGRPCVYLQISVDEVNIGTMIFMLYADIVPRTCENFIRLCKTTKGGYSGTPVHRIVKDCWIQCGGFGIKDTKLDCENFIVPHDRRGVLGMANDGRHVDCSTQFFVLLQPAEWMAHKYVAFGQLIDGEETLKKIELVPTWYESPTRQVTIFKAGILNLECQDIMINKGTNKYIAGHIENLFTVGELFYEALLEKVFLEVDFRSLQRLQDEMVGEGAEVTPEEAAKNLRATQRFMRKKEEVDKQLEKSQADRNGRGTPAVDKVENNDFDVEEYEYEPEEYSYNQVSVVASTSVAVKPDKPFYIPLTDVPYPGDVDSTYNLTKLLKGDYCLDIDLDHDVGKKKQPEQARFSFPSEIFDMLFDTESSESGSQDSLNSEDEREIKKYLKTNADRVSFAGGVIKAMGKTGKLNLFENRKASDLITDETLRRFNLAAEEYRAHREKKVSISVPTAVTDTHKEIKRRHTGFVRPEDLARIRQFQKDLEIEEEEEEEEDDDEEVDVYKPYTRHVSVGGQPAPVFVDKAKSQNKQSAGFVQRDDLEKVHVFHKASSESLLDDDDDDESRPTVQIAAPPPAQPAGLRTVRRPTAFVRRTFVDDDDDDDDDDDIDDDYDHDDNKDERPSLLARLFDDAVPEDMGPGPTLKDYKPYTELHKKTNVFLIKSPNRRIVEEHDSRERFKRHSLSIDHGDKSIDQVLFLQHGTNVYRKISSDYVATIDHIEHKLESSIRSIEYAKTRPAISVTEYQRKNQLYHENQKLKLAKEEKEKKINAISDYPNKLFVEGRRLPDDTPLYHSMIEIPDAPQREVVSQ